MSEFESLNTVISPMINDLLKDGIQSVILTDMDPKRDQSFSMMQLFRDRLLFIQQNSSLKINWEYHFQNDELDLDGVLVSDQGTEDSFFQHILPFVSKVESGKVSMFEELEPGLSVSFDMSGADSQPQFNIDHSGADAFHRQGLDIVSLSEEELKTVVGGMVGQVPSGQSMAVHAMAGGVHSPNDAKVEAHVKSLRTVTGTLRSIGRGLKKLITGGALRSIISSIKTHIAKRRQLAKEVKQLKPLNTLLHESRKYDSGNETLAKNMTTDINGSGTPSSWKDYYLNPATKKELMKTAMRDIGRTAYKLQEWNESDSQYRTTEVGVADDAHEAAQNFRELVAAFEPHLYAEINDIQAHVFADGGDVQDAQLRYIPEFGKAHPKSRTLAVSGLMSQQVLGHAIVASGLQIKMSEALGEPLVQVQASTSRDLYVHNNGSFDSDFTMKQSVELMAPSLGFKIPLTVNIDGNFTDEGIDMSNLKFSFEGGVIDGHELLPFVGTDKRDELQQFVSLFQAMGGSIQM